MKCQDMFSIQIMFPNSKDGGKTQGNTLFGVDGGLVNTGIPNLLWAEDNHSLMFSCLLYNVSYTLESHSLAAQGISDRGVTTTEGG